MKSSKQIKHYKILLIFPRNFSDNYLELSLSVAEFTHKPGGLLILTLGTIASLTPDYASVKIIDENIEEIDFDYECDIVGIGGFSSQIFRAKEIAREFRKRGVIVACGGSSTSLSQERYRPFCDVLLLGEAERIWPEFINDYYIKGEFKSQYVEKEFFDLTKECITPDYSGLSPEHLSKYLGGLVQTSRGCPFNCDFCDTPAYAGRRMRYKSVEQIISEVESLYQLNQYRIIALADDNFLAGRKHAKSILRALSKWNKTKKYPVTFWTQFSIDAAEDDELLKLLVDANVTRVFIGVESGDKEVLTEAGKKQNARSNIEKSIEKISQHGIVISAGCMVGFDHDQKSIFQEQLSFFNSLCVPTVLVWPLQALDQTKLKERIVKEGRYIDWQDYGTPPEALKTRTIIPKNMTTSELSKGAQWLVRELTSNENFFRRVKKFFEVFESSPFKNELKITPTRPRLGDIMIVARLIWKLFLRRETKDLKMLWDLFMHIKTNSHPQKYDILITMYLIMLNSRSILKRAENG